MEDIDNSFVSGVAITHYEQAMVNVLHTRTYAPYLQRFLGAMQETLEGGADTCDRSAADTNFETKAFRECKSIWKESL